MKHISDIVRAYVKAGRPGFGLVALAIHNTRAAMIAVAALGASLRWHDVVWRLLS
jgi:hypothetical protein